MAEYAMLIEYKYCTGCHSCEVACRNEKQIASQEEWGIKLAEFGPEKLDGKWYWNYVAVPSTLCDMCEDRVAKGKIPMCVQHCQAWCMYYGEVEDLAKKIDGTSRCALLTR